jgi:BirA family biotin operon repressor/biotin-[acetyl-CoA-carboxylase] ligase
MSASDRLNAEQIRSGLKSAVIGREIIVFDRTPSTNDEIARLAQEGCAEGTVVFAEDQTAGRGQRGNRWESAPNKGLWFSILLRPEIPISDSGMLTSWAAQIVSATIHTWCDVESRVKPPNDIYISDRKVAGVLVEMKAQPGAPHVAIAGLGINVNQAGEDFSEPIRERATSLLIATGRKHDRNALAVALLRNLDSTYLKLVPGIGVVRE